MDILSTFGIQPVLLAAQVVNFLVLLFILQKFLYKPILKVLKQRQDMIAKSLKDAEKIEQGLKQTDEEREKVLEAAALEAQKLIDEATQASIGIIAEAHLKASADMEKILEQAKEQVRLEKEKMQQEIREELADLVVIGIEKVAGKVLTQKDQKEIVKKTVSQL
jgi:F-type H+-transporting ATPase subunit b